jgi:hypothetical protein
VRLDRIAAHHVGPLAAADDSESPVGIRGRRQALVLSLAQDRLFSAVSAPDSPTSRSPRRAAAESSDSTVTTVSPP